MKPAVEEGAPKGPGAQLERLEGQVDAYQSLNHSGKHLPSSGKKKLSRRKGSILTFVNVSEAETWSARGEAVDRVYWVVDSGQSL